MLRERRFTSMPPELRSPLAALKVQTEVAQLSWTIPKGVKALDQLHRGSIAPPDWWIGC